MPEDSAFRLEFTADPRYLAGARMFAAAVARHFRCAEEVVQDVKVAVTEAAANSIKAHGRRSSSEPICVEAKVRDGMLTFSVVDAGGGIDPDDMQNVPPPGTVEGQVGLLLIRALFPEALIASNDAGGTTVRFAVPVVHWGPSVSTSA